MVGRRWGLVGLVLLVACGKSTQTSSDEPHAGGGGASATEGGSSATVSGGSSGIATVSGGAGTAAGVGGASASLGGNAGAQSLAGGAGTAGSSGGPLVFGPDPTPVGDPPGLVKTSSSYLVFTRQNPDASVANRFQLMFLDLQGDGRPVQISVAGTKVGVRAISKDRHAYLYAQTDPFPFGQAAKPREDDLYLNLLTDSGYVPGALVAGFTGRTALHSLGGFDSTSRFAFVYRPFAPRGIDIIDTARNTRHYSQDFDAESFAFAFAPKGYLFSYTLLPMIADQTRLGRRSYVAKLIDGGISASQLLPAALSNTHFTADGKRLFYTVLNGTDPVSFGYVDPPAATQQFYISSEPSDALAASDFFLENGGESVLTTLAAPNDPTHQVAWRLYSDGTRSPVAVSDPAVSITEAVSESGTLAALFSTADDGTQRIELLHGTERFKLSETKGADQFEGFFVGEHLLYFIYFPDPINNKTSWEVHAVGLQGSKVVDTLISKSERMIYDFCQSSIPLPGNWHQYLLSQPAGIRFIDVSLTISGGTRTVSATDPNATIDDCPICNPAGDTCAYVERTATHSKTFSVHYGADGPSEPKLIYEADQNIGLVAAHW